MSIEMNANSLPLRPGAEPMTVLAGQPRSNSLANKQYRVAGNQNGRGDDGESRSAVERWGVEGSDAAGDTHAKRTGLRRRPRPMVCSPVRAASPRDNVCHRP